MKRRRKVSSTKPKRRADAPRARRAVVSAKPRPRRTSGIASSMVEVDAARGLFWQNVMRQILTSLSVEWLNRNHALPPGARPTEPPPEDLFDGRLGILTHAGERIAIAQVSPVLACGLPVSDTSRQLSVAVECTVFQIRTPTGEVFTLPLSEMRGFHSLTPELMKALEEAARREAESRARDDGAQEAPGTPFGFGAFTSMERAAREGRRGIAFPQHAPDAPNPHPEE